MKPKTVQCANVRAPIERTMRTLPPEISQSHAHSDARCNGNSLQTLALQRLEEIGCRTFPRTLDRTLPPVMCADGVRLAAASVCKSLNGYITANKLLAMLAPDDLKELESSADPLPFLRSYAFACVWTDFRRQGIAPPGWDQAAHCDRCGLVLLWAPIHVAGCPWCWNRIRGFKIPRPEQDAVPPRPSFK